MRNSQYKAITLLSVLFTALFTSVGIAATDEAWVQTPPPTAEASWGILAQGISQTYTSFATPSLMSFTSDGYQFGVSKVIAVKKCDAMGGADCPLSEFQKYHSPMSFCSASNSTDCIQEVTAKSASGASLQVNYLGPYGGDPSWSFKGNSSMNLPTSGQSFLVDIPSAPHAGGSKYLISSVLDGVRYPSDSQFTTNGLQATIWPVSIKTGTYQPYAESLSPTNYSALGVNSGAGGGCEGVQSEIGSCAIASALPLDVSFGIKLKLRTKVDGWIHGRISHVDATVSRAGDGDQLVTISGFPVKVPTIFGWVSKEKAPAALTNFYKAMDPFYLNMGNGYGRCLDPSETSGPCNPRYWESILRSPGTSPDGIQELALWLPIVNDKAVAAPSAWSVRTVSGNLNNCGTETKNLVGFVSTNATDYLPGPPTFNSADGTLDYKVLSTHYLPDNSVSQGSYDLVIDSSVARCIYGFSNAPIKATVSVISSDGSSQAVTTTVTENNGFLRMSANGFTYSNPTIKVKLSQESPSPAPTTSGTAAPSTKKTTITCIKGKLTKSVSAVKPTCPTGYKKK